MKGYQTEKRHIVVSGIATTIVMEHLYWRLLDTIAKHRERTWQAVASEYLGLKPACVRSRPQWLRYALTSGLYGLLKTRQHSRGN
jgi:hypothetical protein